ncbi:ornithine cyclodeaminase family protein [Paraburkholderia sp. SEWSISQ10-3 4]|jgi:alanine dehydrogenase|uniref:ornithine cyclodeaminase family protein n=1 Tax=Paraburkholderia TaxID=1822464 RepID=UPI00190A8E00|nr:MULTISPECIES: ornithine cyclodeaminase family protein [Paraburkholderia]MBK3840214.1 ornithine cyclodeaminase family protein [Paraburkholderia aspalathi]MCX4137692.1 ornithine cyclodeaminase family protein [Paraburkholderia aspalathi]MDN7170383.1 ornithine cyclodeaminase family protein [Paraburkholderia sp. SEWSISQ10-3 4]MDQ6500022.1 ornithine cyclodeaminase family protein [Paraburkholderia aspalathi]CAE6778716.1 Delta(1)-pyrroline-2-carboxylate reductase [Paraburkholderia aspalathi]
MLIIPEQQASQLVSVEDAIDAVGDAFAASYAGNARSYPVVREQTGHADAVFGVKAGFDASLPVLGLKAGGYWPGNVKRGLGNHQSSVLLFDADTGRAVALVGANYLTGIRTGAASALATRGLASPDASILGIVGTGAQSIHQYRATCAVRPITHVLAWDPNPDNLRTLRDLVEADGLRFDALSLEAVARHADVLITVTPSHMPLIRREWIRPGVHINAMGADTIGKQELEVELVAAASIVVDEIQQAISIGECQHAYARGLLTAEKLSLTLGGLVSGAQQRGAADDITIFDGTGTALQDLAVAALAYRRAQKEGLGFACDF